MMEVAPGQQVVVVPDWALATLARKGKPEDLVDFVKLRQLFTQEQLVALDRFSEDGLNVLWMPGMTFLTTHHTHKHSRSLGYTWYFGEEHGNSKHGSEADSYAKNQISELGRNQDYAAKMVQEYILDGFHQPAKNKVDISQSYSVYSASDKLIVVALNQGILSPEIYNRKEEVRLSILRSILSKLYQYYEFPVVHQTVWFEWYLTELDLQK